MSEVRTPRRRRSVAVAPALLDPAELPEDAAGRVAIITVAAPDDIAGAPVPAAPPPPVAHPSFLGAAGGWVVAGFAGVVIVAIFVFGMLLTR